MNRGAIYVATGQKYIAEALESAVSLKSNMPDLRVTLYCDEPVVCPHVDEMIHIEKDQSFPGCGAKIPYIVSSPYDETLFLDSDTYVCSDLSELFAVLEVFDLAAAHAPARAIYEVDSVPDSFPEFNTGVILFRRSPAVQAVLASWANLFARYLERLERREIRWLRPAERRWHLLDDQAAFREALYRSTLRITTLPPEYNCRFSVPGFVDGPVKILHGRGLDLAQAASAINAQSIRRGYEERSGTLRLIRYPEPSGNTYSLENIRYTLRRRGIRWVGATALRQMAGSLERTLKSWRGL